MEQFVAYYRAARDLDQYAWKRGEPLMHMGGATATHDWYQDHRGTQALLERGVDVAPEREVADHA